MQNNVTELTQRLLRALDKNYNVIDMPTVIEIVSLLEKVTITKELLETTRLGKHVNELRRKTNNDALSKRAKELVKKWRNIVLPEPNGHLKTTTTTTNQQQQQQNSGDDDKTRKRPIIGFGSTTQQQTIEQSTTTIKRPKINGQTTEYDFSDNSNSSFKDMINPTTITTILSTTGTTTTITTPPKNVINTTDLNSSNNNNNNSNNNSLIINHQQQQQQDEPQLEQQLPKKRGRKKGSKNHKNLIDEAETSFSNKLAVSRGGHSKVKTTQELIASLQNKTNSIFANNNNNNNNNNTNNNNNNNNTNKIKEDLNIRAAKLTERVSIIDQKLNTNSNRYKNSQKNKTTSPTTSTTTTIESGSVINDKNLLLLNNNDNDEIIIVDDIDTATTTTSTTTKIDDDVDIDIDVDDNETDNKHEIIINHNNINNNTNNFNNNIDDNRIKSLSIEEALKLLPPIDKNVLYDDDDDINKQQPICTCILREIDDVDSVVVGIDVVVDDNLTIEQQQQQLLEQQQQQKHYEFIETIDCPARNYLNNKLNKNCINLNDLHTKYLENINGNYSLNDTKKLPEMTNDGLLYVNVVPNVNNETIPKDVKLINNNSNNNIINNDNNNSNDNNDNNDFNCENFQKYSISESEQNTTNNNNNNNNNSDNSVNITDNDNNDDDNNRTSDIIIGNNNNNNGDDNSGRTFCEWHEVVDVPSYNGEILKILPYVIID